MKSLTEANAQLQWVRRELSGLPESLQCVGEVLLAAEKREDELRKLLDDVRGRLSIMSDTKARDLCERINEALEPQPQTEVSK